MSATSYGWLILAFPLAGLLIISLGWRVLPTRWPGWIASAAIGLSFLASIGALMDLQDHPADDRELVSSAWTYAATIDLNVDVAILIDPLSVFMCLVVSGVSFLIHVYSVAYMGGDRGFARYFAYLNYFVFSMLLLVLAANFVLLIVGWAFVGAASYLLISFWYRRTTATHAGIKAFVINVIGDVGLVIAAFLLLSETGSLDYAGVFERAPEVFGTDDGTLVAACLLILVGAFAKSAQLPLHTWLPDAMEGPDAGLGADPRGHDGHRGRVPDRPLLPAVPARAHRRRHQRDPGHGHDPVRGDGGAGARPTSSASSPTRRSRRSATWCSASRRPPTAPGSSI